MVAQRMKHKASQYQDTVNYEGDQYAQFLCTCGGVYYCRIEDIEEVHSCGHEKARRDPSGFVKPKSKVVLPGRSHTVDEYVERGQSVESMVVATLKNMIRKEAYFQWEQAGRPEGMSDHFWHEAEDRLISMLRNI